MAKKPRRKVFLVSFRVDGTVIERSEVSYDQYYDGSTPVVDSSAFRCERGVRRLTGEIYNSKGQLQQSFDNSYDELGKYVKGRAVHSDGTITED